MTGCGGESMTCSLSVIRFAIFSTNGILTCIPASHVVRYFPRNSITNSVACGTTRTFAKNENHDKCDDPRYYVFHKSLLKASYERMPPLLHRRCFAPKTAHLYGYYITYRIKNQPNGIGFYAKGFGMRKRTVMMMSNIRSARSSAETAFLMRGESFPVIPETAGSTM